MDGKIELSEVQSILNSSKIEFADMFPLNAISSGVLLENNSVNRESLVDLSILKNVTWNTVLEKPNVKSSYNSTTTWVNNSGKRTSSLESVQRASTGFGVSSTVHAKTDTITTETTTSTRNPNKGLVFSLIQTKWLPLPIIPYILTIIKLGQR
jgi:hypothetical protein